MSLTAQNCHKKENSKHILFDCPLYANEREAMITELAKNGISKRNTFFMVQSFGYNLIQISLVLISTKHTHFKAFWSNLSNYLWSPCVTNRLFLRDEGVYDVITFLGWPGKYFKPPNSKI